MTTKLAKFFSKLISKFIWLVSILLILFVLLVSIVKISLPYFLQQKDSITDYVESYIGGEFDYTTLQVDWSDFHPVINITGLNWHSADGNFIINSQSNKIEFDLWTTLYHGDLVSEDIEIKSVNIDWLVNDADDGSVLDLKQVKQTIVSTVKKLKHKYIVISDTQILVKKNEEISSQQNISQLVYKQNKAKKQLLVDSHGDMVSKGRLVIESEGDLFSENSRVNYFANFDEVNLQSIAKLFNLDLSAYSTVNIDTWINQVEDRIDSGKLQIQNDSSNLAKIDVSVNFKLDDGLYQIHSDRFELSLKEGEGYVTHQSFLQLSNESVGKENHYLIKTGIIPIGFAAKIIAPFLPDELANYSHNINAKGLINSMDLRFVESAQAWLPQEGRLVIENLSTTAYDPIPGVQVDTVTITGRDGDWRLDAKTESQSIDFRPMLKAAIPVDKMKLKASFNINQPELILVDSVNFNNSAATVKARGQLNFQDEFLMAIYAEAESVDVAQLHYYWPRNTKLTEKTLEYLDNSLLGGKVSFAQFIWQGEADAFPYKNNDGLFYIQASVNDAKFKFESDWPVANRINGKAYFENEKLTVQASSGNLLGAKLIVGTAILPDLKAPNEQLIIDVKGISNYKSYKSIYQQSPLMELLGEDLLEISFSEQAVLDLNLDLLLTVDDVKSKVDGLISFNGNDIAGIPYDIQLEDAKGKLRFTEDGAISQRLTANFLGEPMSFDVKVADFTDDSSFVQVDAKGAVNLSKSAKKVLGFSPLKVEGVSDFVLHYKIADDNDDSESLIIRSNLIGSAIKGPKWLAKDFSSAAPLLTTLFKNGDTLQIRSSYRDQMSAQLTLDMLENRHPNGLIKLGGIATQNLDVPAQGVAIEGYFDSISVNEWLDTMHFENGDSSGWPQWIERINITTPRLEFAGQEFTKVRINDAKSDDLPAQTMRLNLFSEQARANVTYLQNGQKHLIIEQLDLELETDDNSESVAQAHIPLSEYDNWLFECRTCKINGYEFGPVKLISKFVNDHIELVGNGQVSDQLATVISGSIHKDKTQLEAIFDIPDPNGLLSFWQLDGEMRDTKTEGSIRLQWPGRLHEFALAETDGHFKLSAEDGSIKNLSDRKARIFSLFSLESIPRRLSLDFSDIFSDGFFYDSIRGDFLIDKGVLVSEKVEINGTAADVVVEGRVDLNNLAVDQKVLVTPKLGASLPVLAGWAVEPTTGLIMLIVSKIFEPALNVVSSIEYKIQGALDDPEVIEVSKQAKEVELTDEQIEEQKKLLEPEVDESEGLPAQGDN